MLVARAGGQVFMGLGTSELLLLAVIALLFLGPKEVYQIAHKLGKWMREIQKMSHEFMTELNREADSIERQERASAVDKNVFMTGGGTAVDSGSAPSPTVTDDDPASVFGGSQVSHETPPSAEETPVPGDPVVSSAPVEATAPPPEDPEPTTPGMEGTGT